MEQDPDELRETYLSAMKEIMCPTGISILVQNQIYVSESPCCSLRIDGSSCRLFQGLFPILYYCAYFSVRADDFDLVSMCKGKDAVKQAMKEITDKGLDASVKESTDSAGVSQ